MIATAAGLITLRPLTLDDVTETYVGWLQDPEVTRYLMAGRTPQTARTVRAFVETLLLSAAQPFAILLDGRHVGNTQLQQISGVDGTAEVGILLGDRTCWGQGIGQAAIQALTLAINDRLSAWITARPAEWLWLHRRWPAGWSSSPAT